MQPIWIRANMTHLPNKLKESIGIVNTPVTHVDDVAVKRQSINEMGTSCAIGIIRSAVPRAIVMHTEKRTVLPGELNRYFCKLILFPYKHITLYA